MRANGVVTVDIHYPKFVERYGILEKD